MIHRGVFASRGKGHGWDMLCWTGDGAEDREAPLRYRGEETRGQDKVGQETIRD